ncbi:glycosyltransferase family 61 protein [Nocardioides agariphilus]|uniref:Glycosyltransferase family 61 protein n=1 Tax=Nocardioides agariphilus TaxID=433664 RepID=A0A930VSY7_9ACTN|nr:glycosyltransferase family 61 protein [Nocardioides agariphilus]
MGSPTTPVDIARAAVAGVRSPAVAVVARGAHPDLVARLGQALPDAIVSAFDLDEEMSSVHLALTAGRPWDLVLDVAGGKGAARRWPNLLHHVRCGGQVAVRVPDEATQLGASLAEIRAAQQAGAAAPTPGRDLRDNAERDLAALAASTHDVHVSDGWLRATSDVETLAKVPEEDGDRFLAARPEAGRTLTTIPGLRFSSRCAVRSSAPIDLPAAYDAPAMSLREYADAICLGRQAAYGDGFVLPESYRHPFKRRLRNVAFAEWAPRFVLRPEAPSAALEGPAYLLDTYVRGHFGHALTDQLGHFWGWRAALELHPDLSALIFAEPGEDLAGWEYDLLAAGGVEASRVVVAHEPTRVRLLVASSPMFGMPAYVHPAIATTYAQIGTSLASRATSQTPAPVRIFCSRRPGKRNCHNAQEVEALFEAYGFTVVFPEDHSLPDQVRMVREADVIAGFAGSGMFQIAFAGGPKHVVLVGSESYTASNEYLISSVLGHRLDLVLCRPDVPKRESGGFSVEWYQSDFTYDDAREGVFLREVLAGL